MDRDAFAKHMAHRLANHPGVYGPTATKFDCVMLAMEMGLIGERQALALLERDSTPAPPRRHLRLVPPLEVSDENA